MLQCLRNVNAEHSDDIPLALVGINNTPPVPTRSVEVLLMYSSKPQTGGKDIHQTLCLTNPLQPFSLFFFQALVLLFYLYVAHSPVRVFITHAFMISDITSGGAYHIHLCVITVAHGEKSSPEAGQKCLRLWCTTSSLCIRRPLMTLIDTTCLQTYTHTEQRCARVSKKGAHLSYP